MRPKEHQSVRLLLALRILEGAKTVCPEDLGVHPRSLDYTAELARLPVMFMNGRRRFQIPPRAWDWAIEILDVKGRKERERERNRQRYRLAKMTNRERRAS